MLHPDLPCLLGRLCPMFLLVDATGHIERAGPTLQKLRPADPLRGRRFLEVFKVERPRVVTVMQDLMEQPATRLHVRFRDPPATALKGIILPLPEGAGAIVNLSFGISVLEAVRDYDLSSADFSATDLTIELLYLVEAKSAAMSASRKLNQRLQGAMIAAEEKAYTDTLTGLRNRRAVDFVLERIASSGSAFSLMNLDLDYFKQVNDTKGHAAGDHVLRSVAAIMREECREDDTVARVGGDEFVLIFEGLTDRARLEQIAERLSARILQPIAFGDGTCRVAASIGIVIGELGGGFAGESDTGDTGDIHDTVGRAGPDEILHRADLALYAAKRAGRACHRFYDMAMAPAASA